MNTIKIALTGSSGLAAEISNVLNEACFETGGKIFSVEGVRIEDNLDPEMYDVFINLAHIDFVQVNLLYKFYESWRDDSEKYILNISSRASKSNISKGYIYAAQKAALNHLSDNLVYNSNKKCRITTLNLGLLEHSLPSLKYKEVAQLVKYLLLLPKHIEIPDLTLQNAANYRKLQSEKTVSLTGQVLSDE